MLGCTRQAVKLPNRETEARAPREQQPSAVYRIEDFTTLKQSPGVTPHCAWQIAGRVWQQCLLLGVEEGGGRDVRLAHRLWEKPSVGQEANVGSTTPIKPYD